MCQDTSTVNIFCISFIGENQKGSFIGSKIIEETDIIKAIEKFYRDFPNNEVIGVKNNSK